jgi:hypothetical protein
LYVQKSNVLQIIFTRLLKFKQTYKKLIENIFQKLRKYHVLGIFNVEGKNELASSFKNKGYEL